MLFFDPTTLTLDGSIAITGLDNSAPAEHFQIVGVPEGGITKYYGLGMSKQMWRSILYSWGALKVWKIHQTRTGWETAQARFEP